MIYEPWSVKGRFLIFDSDEIGGVGPPLSCHLCLSDRMTRLNSLWAEGLGMAAHGFVCRAFCPNAPHSTLKFMDYSAFSDIFRLPLSPKELCAQSGKCRISGLRFWRVNRRFHPLTMDKDVTQSADFYRLVAWLHANRQRLIRISVAVLAVAAVITGYVLYKQHVETAASEALSLLKPPRYSEEALNINAADAEPFLKLAQERSGTRAAARALIIGGGILFDAGKFDKSQEAYEQFLREYPEDPLASQAMIGVASSLEAQGKLADATARFSDLIKRHQADATTPQAKSALARLYLAQNKPELALQYYEELARANNNDTWTSEAGIQIQELLAKYPNLRKPVAPAPAPLSTFGTNAATATVPKLEKP